MKVTYEFNYQLGDEDYYKLQVFEKADKMLFALDAIKEYLRQWRKGWNNDDAEKMEETISEIIYDSMIGEIE